MEHKIDESHAIIEKAILAVFINNPALIIEHVLQVKPAYFHEPNYASLYQMMYELVKQKEVVDQPILFHYLNLVQTEIDWQTEFGALLEGVDGPGNLPYFIKKLEENYLDRQMAEIAFRMSQTDTPISIRLNQSLQQILVLKQALNDQNNTSLGELLKQFMKSDTSIFQSRLVTSGIRELDKLLGGGFDLKEMVVVAARPGMGKSALLLNMCNHILDIGKHKVLFVSMQLNPLNFIAKLLANRLNCPLDNIKSAAYPAEFDACCTALFDAEKEGRFKFLYKTEGDFTGLMADINTYKRQLGVDVVIIDSLQMLDGENPLHFQNRHNAIGKNLRQLKQLAQEENFLLIVGSEIGRSAERRFSVDKRPMLSDLKDSGAIEELADKVLMIYRPEYYQLQEWEDGEPTKGTGELLLLKNNMGNLGEVRVAYQAESHRFSDCNGVAEDPDIHQFNDYIPPNRAHEFE